MKLKEKPLMVWTRKRRENSKKPNKIVDKKPKSWWKIHEKQEKWLQLEKLVSVTNSKETKKNVEKKEENVIAFCVSANKERSNDQNVENNEQPKRKIEGKYNIENYCMHLIWNN